MRYSKNLCALLCVFALAPLGFACPGDSHEGSESGGNQAGHGATQRDEHQDHANHDGNHKDDHDGDHEKERDDGQRGHDSHAGHDDHHGHGGGQNVGPGMAVLAADEETGIELSAVALERLGAGFTPLISFAATAESFREFLVPADAVIAFEDQTQIFLRHSNQRIRPYAVRAGARSGDLRQIRIVDPAFEGVSRDTELATRAAALVRLAYLEAFGASGSGHGH
ncbi:MAG: hypothetical protein RIF32_02865 [Leptospirales bacterium]|jgi:hypothetical protein